MATGGAPGAGAALGVAAAPAGGAQVVFWIPGIRAAVERDHLRDRDRHVVLYPARSIANGRFPGRLDRPDISSQSRVAGAGCRRFASKALHLPGPGNEAQVQSPVDRRKEPDVSFGHPAARQRLLERRRRLHRLDGIRSVDDVGVRQWPDRIRGLGNAARLLRVAFERIPAVAGDALSISPTG